MDVLASFTACSTGFAPPSLPTGTNLLRKAYHFQRICSSNNYLASNKIFWTPARSADTRKAQGFVSLVAPEQVNRSRLSLFLLSTNILHTQPV
jgi:hypothetical protein